MPPPAVASGLPTRVATMDTLDWDQLVAQYWDREPVLVTSLPVAPFEAAEVFQAAVAGSRALAGPMLPEHIQFCIERDQQMAAGDWLPGRSDRSFAGYQRRMAEQLRGRRYALVMHHFHSFHPPQWQRQRTFYRGLWERVGLPLTGAITTMFHGSYEHSPVGVHQDRFATFMYTLSGHKRMRFWPHRPWPEPVSTMLDYQPYLDSSLAVEVAAGQLLYWPASFHHVGESDLSDQPATSVNIGVPRFGHHAKYDLPDFLFGRPLEPLLAPEVDPARRPPEPAGLLAPPPAGADLDGRLPAALAEVAGLLGAGDLADRIDDRVAALALRHWTADGFLPAPAPPAPQPLADRDTVRAVARIEWAAGSQVRLCAANGHLTRTPLPAGQLGELVAALRSGAALPVAGRPAAVRQLLAELASFGALTRV